LKIEKDDLLVRSIWRRLIRRAGGAVMIVGVNV